MKVMSWKEFECHHLADFDRDRYPKVLKGLVNVIKRIPRKVCYKHGNVLVVATDCYGVSFACRGYKDIILLNLKDLELETQEEIEFTIAHEFAHGYLGHHTRKQDKEYDTDIPWEDRPQEKAANDLAAKWGFYRRP
jgi:hypothetical protein